VPDDLSVVGFDDVDAAAYAGLTTVHQPLVESGREAARIVRAELAG
jgi:DNA-binding LacI/PurR family transcriptional regulator